MVIFRRMPKAKKDTREHVPLACHLSLHCKPGREHWAAPMSGLSMPHSRVSPTYFFQITLKEIGSNFASCIFESWTVCATYSRRPISIKSIDLYCNLCKERRISGLRPTVIGKSIAKNPERSLSQLFHFSSRPGWTAFCYFRFSCSAASSQQANATWLRMLSDGMTLKPRPGFLKLCPTIMAKSSNTWRTMRWRNWIKSQLTSPPDVGGICIDTLMGCERKSHGQWKVKYCMF